MMIILSSDERQKFVAWLEQEAASDRMLIDQIQKLPIPGILARMREIEMQAKLDVARILKSFETQVLNG